MKLEPYFQISAMLPEHQTHLETAEEFWDNSLQWCSW